ncbi:MAG TPA: hypothetical protein VIJ63_14315 [Roseiarcus sp.]
MKLIAWIASILKIMILKHALAVIDNSDQAALLNVAWEAAKPGFAGPLRVMAIDANVASGIALTVGALSER